MAAIVTTHDRWKWQKKTSEDDQEEGLVPEGEEECTTSHSPEERRGRCFQPSSDSWNDHNNKTSSYNKNRKRPRSANVFSSDTSIRYQEGLKSEPCRPDERHTTTSSAAGGDVDGHHSTNNENHHHSKKKHITGNGQRNHSLAFRGSQWSNNNSFNKHKGRQDRPQWRGSNGDSAEIETAIFGDEYRQRDFLSHRDRPQWKQQNLGGSHKANNNNRGRKREAYESPTTYNNNNHPPRSSRHDQRSLSKSANSKNHHNPPPYAGRRQVHQYSSDHHNHNAAFKTTRGPSNDHSQRSERHNHWNYSSLPTQSNNRRDNDAWNGGRKYTQDAKNHQFNETNRFNDNARGNHHQKKPVVRQEGRDKVANSGRNQFQDGDNRRYSESQDRRGDNRRYSESSGQKRFEGDRYNNGRLEKTFPLDGHLDHRRQNNDYPRRYNTNNNAHNPRKPEYYHQRDPLPLENQGGRYEQRHSVGSESFHASTSRHHAPLDRQNHPYEDSSPHGSKYDNKRGSNDRSFDQQKMSNNRYQDDYQGHSKDLSPNYRNNNHESSVDNNTHGRSYPSKDQSVCKNDNRELHLSLYDTRMNRSFNASHPRTSPNQAYSSPHEDQRNVSQRSLTHRQNNASRTQSPLKKCWRFGEDTGTTKYPSQQERSSYDRYEGGSQQQSWMVKSVQQQEPPLKEEQVLQANSLSKNEQLRSNSVYEENARRQGSAISSNEKQSSLSTVHEKERTAFTKIETAVQKVEQLTASKNSASESSTSTSVATSTQKQSNTIAKQSSLGMLMPWLKPTSKPKKSVSKQVAKNALIKSNNASSISSDSKVSPILKGANEIDNSGLSSSSRPSSPTSNRMVTDSSEGGSTISNNRDILVAEIEKSREQLVPSAIVTKSPNPKVDIAEDDISKSDIDSSVEDTKAATRSFQAEQEDDDSRTDHGCSSSDDSDTDDEEVMMWASKMFGVPFRSPSSSKTEDASNKPTEMPSPSKNLKLKLELPQAEDCRMELPSAMKTPQKKKMKQRNRSLEDKILVEDVVVKKRKRGRPKKKKVIEMKAVKEISKEETKKQTEEERMKKESAKPLTAEQIKAILGEDDFPASGSTNWVRRSVRQPSKDLLNSKGLKRLVDKLKNNDPDIVVLKMKKFINDSNAPEVVLDAVLDALEENTNCESLYIQNFNQGLRDKQVMHLLKILQDPKCQVWCLNVGENYNVKTKTWDKFTKGLRKTKVTHMYASEHTITTAMKDDIRKSIRNNRKKHDRHINPNNLDVIIQCTHCWWNPINAKVLRPYLKKEGLDSLLSDREAQGLRGSTSAATII